MNKSSPESPAKEQPGEAAAMVKRLCESAREFARDQAGVSILCQDAAAMIEKLGQGWIPVDRVAEYQEHHFKAEDVGIAWNGNRIWVCIDGAALLRAKLFDGKFQVLFSPPPPERP